MRNQRSSQQSDDNGVKKMLYGHYSNTALYSWLLTVVPIHCAGWAGAGTVLLPPDV